MKTRRRLARPLLSLLLAGAGCHAVLGLDEPTVTSADAGVAAAIEADAADDVVVDAHVDDARNDVPIADAGCWADFVLVEDSWPDLLNTPVPQPAAATGVSNRVSYDASVPGEVWDDVTKLTWLVEADGGTSPYGTHAEAVAACAATRLEWARDRGKAGKYSLAEAHCETLPNVGRNAWRVPTYSELPSIVYTERENPAIDPLAFETEQGIYWTSSLPGWFPNNRIVVPFSDGQRMDVRNDNVNDVWVRCVRTMD